MKRRIMSIDEYIINEKKLWDKIYNFFKPLKAGTVIIRENLSRSKDIYIFIELTELGARVFKIGTFSYNAYNNQIASIVHNTKDGILQIREGTWRRLNNEERKLLKETLENGKKINKRYLDNIKKKTNLEIKF